MFLGGSPMSQTQSCDLGCWRENNPTVSGVKLENKLDFNAKNQRLKIRCPAIKPWVSLLLGEINSVLTLWGHESMVKGETQRLPICFSPWRIKICSEIGSLRNPQGKNKTTPHMEGQRSNPKPTPSPSRGPGLLHRRAASSCG